MIFRYTPTGDRARRTWRPELVPHIVEWLDSIPADLHDLLASVNVTPGGGFEARFVAKTNIEAPPLSAYFRFDSPDRMYAIYPRGWYSAPRIVPFCREHLACAFDSQTVYPVTPNYNESDQTCPHA